MPSKQTPKSLNARNTTNLLFWRKFSIRGQKVFKLLGIIFSILVIFFIGYQLAIYQEDNDDTLLPHFDFNTNQDCVSAGGCGILPTSHCPPNSGGCMIADEPVIYLYPTHTQSVNVKVAYAAGFSQTVPQYNSAYGWKVIAQPNGSLTNQATGQTYPYLIWEGNPTTAQFDMTAGFVVAGADTKPFLERQLSTMGLNQSEINSFIDYWLPKMQSDPFNVIHFAGSDYTKLAPLNITPKPDSLLRVFMAFRATQQPVKVTPQVFPRFQHTGFTVVEWGGTKLP